MTLKQFQCRLEGAFWKMGRMTAVQANFNTMRDPKAKPFTADQFNAFRGISEVQNYLFVPRKK